MPRTAPFTVTAALCGGVATVAGRGDAHITTAPALEAMLAMALGNNPTRPVVRTGRA